MALVQSDFDDERFTQLDYRKISPLLAPLRRFEQSCADHARAVDGRLEQLEAFTAENAPVIMQLLRRVRNLETCVRQLIRGETVALTDEQASSGDDDGSTAGGGESEATPTPSLPGGGDVADEHQAEDAERGAEQVDAEHVDGVPEAEVEAAEVNVLDPFVASSVVIPYDGNPAVPFGQWCERFTDALSLLGALTEEQKLARLRVMVTGRARQCLQAMAPAPTTVQAALDHLAATFDNDITRSIGMNNLSNLAQLPGEAVFTFASRLNQAVRVAHSGEPEQAILEHLKREFVNRLTSELQFHVKAKQPGDYTAAYNEAELYELLLNARQARGPAASTRYAPAQVAALQLQMQDLSLPDSDQRGRDNSRGGAGREGRRCYYCHRPGHVIRDCRQRRSDEQRNQGGSSGSATNRYGNNYGNQSYGSNYVNRYDNQHYRNSSPAPEQRYPYRPQANYHPSHQQTARNPSPGRHQSPARGQSPSQSRQQSPHPRSVRFGPAPIRTLDAGPPVQSKPATMKGGLDKVPYLCMLFAVMAFLSPAMATTTNSPLQLGLTPATPMLCLADSAKSIWKLPRGSMCPDEEWFAQQPPTPYSLEFFRPNTIRYESAASVCKCWSIEVCRRIKVFGGWEEVNTTTVNVPTISQCWDMVKFGTSPAGALRHYTNYSTTTNTLSDGWPSWPNVFWDCQKAANCHMINTTVFTRFGSEAIATPAGPTPLCHYNDGSCILSHSSLVWNPEPQQRCSMVPVTTYAGSFASGVWVADNINFALSFENQTVLTSCNETLLLTDQGYGIRQSDYSALTEAQQQRQRAKRAAAHHNTSVAELLTEWNRLLEEPNRRAKRNVDNSGAGIVYTNQLAASLTHVAHRLESTTRRLFTTAVRQICGLIENVTDAVLSLASAHPTMLARKILNNTYTSARLINADLLEIQPCIPMAMGSVHFHHRPSPAVCYDRLPIRFLYDDHLRDGFLDPITNIITSEALEFPCATHRYVYVPISDARLQRYDQLSGEIKFIAPGDVQEARRFGKIDLPAALTQTIIRNHVIADLSEITDLAAQMSTTLKYSDLRRQLQALNMDPATTSSRSFAENVRVYAEAVTKEGMFAFLHGGLFSSYQLWIFSCCAYITVQVVLDWLLPAIVNRLLGPLNVADGVRALWSVGRRQYQNHRQRRRNARAATDRPPMYPALPLQDRAMPLALPEPNQAAFPQQAAAPPVGHDRHADTRIMTMEPPMHLDEARVWGTLNGKRARMLIDTGASISVCDVETAVYFGLTSRCELHRLQPSLVPSVMGIDDQPICPLGWTECELGVGTTTCKARLHVMADPIGHRTSPYHAIIGYDTLRLLPPLMIDAATGNFWFLPPANLATPSQLGNEINIADGSPRHHRLHALIPETLNYTERTQLATLLEHHDVAFSKHDYDIGDCDIVVSPVHTTTETPIAARPSRLPEKVREESNRHIAKMVEAGIAIPDCLPWLANLVLVMKANGETRPCVNYFPLNAVTVPDHYPLPLIKTLLERISGHRYYTTLDLASGFWQLKLDEESSRKCGIITENGTYRMLRLPFGLRNAPAVFQRVMDDLLKGIPGVLCYLDDIVVFSNSFDEHIATLDLVLQRLQERGLKLKPAKCKFVLPSLTYLGHEVNENGYSPSNDHLRAIADFPTPSDAKALQRFLGLTGFFRKFISGYATVVHPLQVAIRDEFEWGEAQQSAFERLKQLMLEEPILRPPDYTLPFMVYTDASGVAVGGVLLQTERDGSNPHAVAYTSKALSATESRWPATHIELYGIVHCLKAFRNYLHQADVTIYTDHQPLTYLMQHASTSPKLNRWLLMLQEHSPKIRYVKGKANTVADCLSRAEPALSWDDTVKDLENKMGECPYVLAIDTETATKSAIQAATEQDDLLAEVIRLNQRNWTNFTMRDALRPYHQVRESLSVHCGTLQMNGRVVIPASLRVKATELLHRGHLGINKMKAKARRHLWWPAINKDLEELGCPTCAALAHQPARVQLQQWPMATYPMERMHMDLAGPYLGATWLIIVDSYSRYAFVERLTESQLDSPSIVRILRKLFSEHGYPMTMVTDNGPQFVSDYIREFYADTGITPLTSPSYHPSSNGAAERMVGLFKDGVTKLTQEGHTPLDALNTWLTEYRSTPTNTGDSPAFRFLGRELRTPLSVFIESGSFKELKERARQRQHYRGPIVPWAKQFQPGATVWVKKGERQFEPALVKEALGQAMYQVQLLNGTTNVAHVDQLMARRPSNRAPAEINCLSADLEESYGHVPGGPTTDPGYLADDEISCAESEYHECTPIAEDKLPENDVTLTERYKWTPPRYACQIMVLDRAVCKLSSEPVDEATRKVERAIRFGTMEEAKKTAAKLVAEAKVAMPEKEKPNCKETSINENGSRPKRFATPWAPTFYVTRTNPPLFFCARNGTMPGRLQMAPRDLFRGNKAGYVFQERGRGIDGDVDLPKGGKMKRPSSFRR